VEKMVRMEQAEIPVRWEMACTDRGTESLEALHNG